MLFARRPRRVFAALALVALALGSLPLASPAAAPARPASTARPATAHPTASKTAAKPGAKAGAKHSAAAKPKAKPTAKPLFSYKDAPADEYFGRLKLSILGVRSKVKDLGLDADTHPEHDTSILSTALFIEDAMRDWARKYPYDHWLPRYAFALEVMYERIPGSEAHQRARRQLNYITAYFPQTVYGKVGRSKLVAGIPTPDPSATPATELERLALIDGKVRPTIPPLVLATPSPEASAGPESSPGPAPSAAPGSSPLPGASPLPATSPLPGPSAVPSARPSPEPSPAGGLTPAPSASAAASQRSPS